VRGGLLLLRRTAGQNAAGDYQDEPHRCLHEP